MGWKIIQLLFHDYLHLLREMYGKSTLIHFMELAFFDTPENITKPPETSGMKWFKLLISNYWNLYIENFLKNVMWKYQV